MAVAVDSAYDFPACLVSRLCQAARRCGALRNQKGLLCVKRVCTTIFPSLNQTLGLLAAVTIVCYIIYTVSPEVETRFNNRYVYLTAVFVIAGILRYLQMTIVDVKSGSPTKILLKDRFIRCCIALWMLSFVIILYL